MSESTGDLPILVNKGTERPDQQWVISEDAIIIGRGEDCNVILSARQVSRHHLRLYREGDAYYLEDLESRNGTWVNDAPLTGTQRLYDGDLINVAMVEKLQFLGTGATAPLPYKIPPPTGGRLRLDQEARRVFIGKTEINPPLSPPQYRLLELLYNSMGRVCTRDEVIETVWPDAIGEGVSEQAIDALVRRLRDRLAEADPGAQFIVTVRGHGFRLENPSDTKTQT